METITTPAGITLAFDRYVGGDAGTVILIGGAFGYREFPKMVELARRLADEYGLTVINYDRRGRGDSSDVPGIYNVENEINDLLALLEAVGGSATLLGWSSGAVLALRAAHSGRVPGITGVVAFEPPVVATRDHYVPPADLDKKLHELIAADQRGTIVRYYMVRAMGVPRMFVAAMRLSGFWKKLTATAPSTAHDWAVMAPFMRGTALRPADWAGVTVPTLVISGGRSGALLQAGARAVTEVLPNARHVEIPKLSHDPDISLLLPPAGEFISGTGEYADWSPAKP
ncbi:MULTISPECIES: alpha/beta fold hydrolase [unclassified Nocardia]|uniref:alpha/beta fold hydrolase n=1 Tax=unclassified Nocardia TaxID=2637762 RepID=UPI00278BC30E|nr:MULTISPECIES: alpha/beta hydrolase [unclassified Nocardia]